MQIPKLATIAKAVAPTVSHVQTSHAPLPKISFNMGPKADMVHFSGKKH